MRTRSGWLPRAVRRRLAPLLASLAVLLLAGGPPAQAETVLLPPTVDPFYRAAGALDNVAPGTVLQTRTVGLAPTGTPLPVQATQLLYRTTGQRGEPAATVATVIRPATSGPIRLVSYQTAYDALGARCDPSFTLRGGGPGALADAPVIAGFLAAGFTVVTSDYEGTELAYGAPRTSGYATLDGIRAALTALGAPAAAPVGLSGFSGGSIATEFAAELAPDYAPELDIVGTAAGGLPVDLADTLAYIDGKPDPSTLLPYVFEGMARGFGIDLAPYLSDYGKQVVTQVADQCVFDGPKFPGLRIDQLLQPQYRDYRSVPAFAAMLDGGRMGSAGTPRGPVFLAGGNSDGIGDGVIVAADERALAADYCRRGVAIRYEEYPGADHLVAGALFVVAAQAFLQAAFDGAPFENSCAAVGSQ
ncbi:lipase family protein [Nocardia sp. NPDC051052]|uniref:lipase family protein n=1 Tax=Nocardia sp. NPDC051052 TaxID=3364322 RepID=UPI0037B60079